MFFASEEMGVVRRYLTNAEGNFYVDPTFKDRAAWEELHGEVKITREGEALLS